MQKLLHLKSCLAWLVLTVGWFDDGVGKPGFHIYVALGIDY